MQTVTHFTMTFLPANDPRRLVPKNGPAVPRAFFHWQAEIAGKKWGKVVELDGAPMDLDIDEFRRLALQALDEMEAVRLMSDQEMAEAEEAAAAATRLAS